ncbi:hypothetical protein ZTR_11227 [Talaromyces verruculosus]|nr:hypothetical protein ZTR_11227 [Talaromyces verruculosus]
MSDSESSGRDDPVFEAQLSRTESLRAAAHSFSPAHEFVFVAVVCMAQFMTQAALGACLSPLDIIGESFDITNPGILSWLIAGYSLTVGTFILFFGRCGDLFGYRLMLLIGFSWFSVWSLVAGVSIYSNYILFIFARALQGLGPAMLFPNGLAILGATYPPGNKKRLIFALFGGMAPSGAVVGSVFAALLAELAWWPWAFWCTAIYCMLLAVIVYLVVPSTLSHTADMSLTKILAELDVMGAALGVTGLVLVNIAWNQAPVVGWQKAYVYVLLIVGFMFLAAFIYYEVSVSKQPLIPFETLNTDVCFILGISIGLGIAGTVEVHINNGGLTFDDKLKGYHAGQYTGIGIGGLESEVTGRRSSLNFLVPENPVMSRHVTASFFNCSHILVVEYFTMTGGYAPKHGSWQQGWGGHIARAEKGVATYTLSPNRQRLFPNFWHTAIFNTFRRFRHQVLYVAPPFIVAYSLMDWAVERNEYLNSKAGRAEAGDE